MQPKALISYFFRPDSIPLGFACKDAFQELGWHAEGFDSQAEHPAKPFLKPLQKFARGTASVFGKTNIDILKNTRFGDQNYREQRFEQAIANFRPDLLLIIRGNGYRPEFLKYIKEHYQIKHLVGWWVKDPRADRQMIDDAKSYDQYFCIHSFGYDAHDNIQLLPATGVYDQLYRPGPSRTESNLSHELVFVGGASPRRLKFLSPLLNKRTPLEIYGPGWLKLGTFLQPGLWQAHQQRGIWGSEMVRLYQTSKVVINITSWDPKSRGGQNLRIFDVPSTGAFLLTDDSDEIREIFKIGQEVETFASPEELADKAQFYLQHPELREKIALAGLNRSRQLPRVRDRIKQMLAAVTCE